LSLPTALATVRMHERSLVFGCGVVFPRQAGVALARLEFFDLLSGGFESDSDIFDELGLICALQESLNSASVKLKTPSRDVSI
jgi:hypothetical protein